MIQSELYGNIQICRIKSLQGNKLKNRDGEADKTIGLEFVGEVGGFSELKKSQDMTDAEYARVNKIKKSF